MNIVSLKQKSGIQRLGVKVTKLHFGSQKLILTVCVIQQIIILGKSACMTHKQSLLNPFKLIVEQSELLASMSQLSTALHQLKVLLYVHFVSRKQIAHPTPHDHIFLQGLFCDHDASKSP